MNKSIYSLVLTDEIVREIDRLAYENSTSRSNMVNQILAEYVSYTTPEKRMREIFSEMENMLTGNDTFQVLLQPSESMFSLRSALTYKYNPTVRYSVELDRSPVPYVGELRVSVRSQNSALRLYLIQFYKLWTELERMYIGSIDCAIVEDRFIRKLSLNPETESTSQTIGQAISGYIRLFDRSMNLFFTNLNCRELAVDKMETLLKEYLAGSPAIL